jgi:Uma2 family endonuclease
MPTAVTELLPQVSPPRKRWTREECDELAALGVFDQQRLELIEGELIDKMGKKRPHVTSVGLLLEWLGRVFGARFVLQEGPIDVAPEDDPTNEPEPDLIVLKRDLLQFSAGNPQPQDLQLVIEVSDSTLHFDLTTKARLYARAGIAEYWVLDIAGRCMIVHRGPGAGGYASVVAYSERDSVSPLAAPGSALRIADVFPA